MRLAPRKFTADRFRYLHVGADPVQRRYEL